MPLVQRELRRRDYVADTENSLIIILCNSDIQNSIMYLTDRNQESHTNYRTERNKLRLRW